jgi:hypothetical protein
MGYPCFLGIYGIVKISAQLRGNLSHEDCTFPSFAPERSSSSVSKISPNNIYKRLIKGAPTYQTNKYPDKKAIDMITLSHLESVI